MKSGCVVTDYAPTILLKGGEIMKTRNGIYYNLAESEYYSVQGELIFFFSSQLYRDKFNDKVEENREQINNSLTNRFGIEVDVSTLADIVLYQKIEKRGFYIVTQEGNKLWEKSNITFVGKSLTYKNYSEQ